MSSSAAPTSAASNENPKSSVELKSKTDPNTTVPGTVTSPSKETDAEPESAAKAPSSKGSATATEGKTDPNTTVPVTSPSEKKDDERESSAEAPSSKGSVAATEGKSFFYLDDKLNCQGPRSAAEMISWYTHGWFNGGTLVKEKLEEPWVSFQDVPELWGNVKPRHDDNTNPMKQEPGKTRSGNEEKLKLPQKKRAVGSRSANIRQIKDAVVRGQFEALAKKVAVVQTMTTYDTEKKRENNPSFEPYLVVFDAIAPRPDTLNDGEKEREYPLFACMVPDDMDAKNVGKQLESLGKAMQQSSNKYHQNKKRKFDWMTCSTPKEFHEVLYGSKQKKGKKGEKAHNPEGEANTRNESSKTNDQKKGDDSATETDEDV